MPRTPTTPDYVLSAILAGLGFAVLFLLVELPLQVCLVLVSVAFLAGVAFLRTKSEAQEERESNHRTLLQNGRAQRRSIASLAQQITKPAVGARAAAIVASIDKILGTLEEDPSKIPAALQFLDYYLNTTVKVLRVYLNLSAKGVLDPEVQQSLTKAEDALETVAVGFETQLTKLLSQDVSDLNAELKVLEQNLLGDGLIDVLKIKTGRPSPSKKS